MTPIYKTTALFLLLLCAQTQVMAQNQKHEGLFQELKTLQKQLVPDKRVAILDIQLNDTILPIVISGETNLPDAKAQIIRLITQKGLTVVDSIRLLPDAALGDKTWALATLSVSNLRSQPDHASEMVSQTLMGTPMKVLDVKDNWFRVQTPEHYIGWMDANGLQCLNSGEMERWKMANRYEYKQVSGFAIDAPSRKGKVVSDLVIGDLFEVEARVKRFFKIRFPDGRTGYVRKSQCLSFRDWSNLKPDVQTILSAARQMMGFPYLWGGTSSKGVDCSGFVKQAYYSQGIIVARDASQQARYGELIDHQNTSNLQAGDLLFFGRSNRQITHVGIYMGKGDFIHSSGKVHISSIDANDPKYVPTRNFVAACRVLNSLNTEGIVSVKHHPWYSIQP